MKLYKFLVPVGVAASALAGSAVKADAPVKPDAAIEALPNSATPSGAKVVSHSYIANGEEHTLLLKLSDGVPSAQHGSHVSHNSHSSHVSHSSHGSSSHDSHSSHSSHSSHTSGF
jgi:hypothetical protein